MRDGNKRAVVEFEQAANEIDTIFESYTELHDVYTQSFKSISSELGGAISNTGKVLLKNKEQAFRNASRTVNKKQSEIANKLYAQGIVLLVGLAESFMRELFNDLIRQNIRNKNLTFGKNTVIPANLVVKADNDFKLAELILEQMNNRRNPAQKMNFQNARQMQGIFSYYLKIKISDEIIAKLHEYYQIRHVIVHCNSVIDGKFMDNLTVAEINDDRYEIGQRITVSKEDYCKCKDVLSELFEQIDQEIIRNEYSYYAIDGWVAIMILL